MGAGDEHRLAIGSGSIACAISGGLGSQSAVGDVSGLFAGLIGPGDHKSVQPMTTRSFEYTIESLEKVVRENS